MRPWVVVVASVVMALPLAGRASAKKLDDFRRKELQEMRQERRDTKAELLDEERQQQEENYEKKREQAGQSRHRDDLDEEDDLDLGGED